MRSGDPLVAASGSKPGWGALFDEWRGACGDPALVSGAAGTRSLLHGASRQVQRLLPRLCRRSGAQPQPPELGHSQGAYAEPGGTGPAGLGRSARQARHRVQLLRRGRGRGSLAAVVEGVKFVRKLCEPLHERGRIAAEEIPGPEVQTDAQIADFVRDNCWGHHASCSCPIGPADQGGVLDSRLRVHGTSGLRIADASVFPRIPGFFIASAVYMIGEKAADMVLEDAQSQPHSEGQSLYGT